MEHGRKAFHFDLDVNKLRETYPSEHPKAYNAAWSKIKAFMEEHGFEHSQYSGYESRGEMSYDKAYAVLFELSIAYRIREEPWDYPPPVIQRGQRARRTVVGEPLKLRAPTRKTGGERPRQGTLCRLWEALRIGMAPRGVPQAWTARRITSRHRTTEERALRMREDDFSSIECRERRTRTLSKRMGTIPPCMQQGLVALVQAGAVKTGKPALPGLPLVLRRHALG